MVGFLNGVYFRSFITYCIKLFHVSPDASRPFPLLFAGLPSVFPDHTIVVISGVYPATHKSRGNIFLFTHPLTITFEVPVFAAESCHGKSRYVFQNDGRAVVSDKISVMIYAAPESIASDCTISDFIMFPSVSIIFRIGVVSILFPFLANVAYTFANSNGLISHVPRDIGAPYKLEGPRFSKEVSPIFCNQSMRSDSLFEESL